MPKRGFIIPDSGGRCIRDRLKKLGYAQEEFAEDVLDVTGRTLRNWISGKTQIDEHNLEKMLMHIGLGVVDVFGEKLPKRYQEKSTLSKLLSTFQRLVVGGEIKKAFDKYKSYLKDLAEHVTFHRIPLKGPYFMYEHDEAHRHRYAVVEITLEDAEEATFILSWQFLNLVRVNLGEVIVTKDEITTKPFFQKYAHTVKRNKDDDNKCCFGFWLAQDGSYFFVEAKEPRAFGAHIREFITEKEHDDRQDEIAVFWRGVYL